VTLGSSAASVTFSSIPATYRDLIVVMNATGSASFVKMWFNGDTTGSNYTQVSMYNTAGSPTSGTEASIFVSIFNLDEQQVSINQIMDYSATDKHKTVLTRGNRTGTNVSAYAARWANTSAITSVQLQIGSGNFNVGSRFDIYGVIA
jgi:hypothetical protein